MRPNIVSTNASPSGPRLTTDQLLAEALRLHGQGQFAEAETRYQEVLRRRAADPDALHHLGLLRYQRGDAASAIALIQKALKKRPTARMYLNLGASYRKQNEPLRAVAAYQKCIALDPAMAEAYYNLGHAQRMLDAPEQAIDAYKAYVALKPQDAEAHACLGDAYAAAKRHEDAIGAYDTALIFEPNDLRAYQGILAMLHEIGWFHAKLAVMERIRELAPTDANVCFNHATLVLESGRLSEGWPDLESRFTATPQLYFRRPSPPAYWGGEDLSGKRILVWTEQGIGDEILHASMVPDVMARARHCIIECSPRLVPVFARSFPQATVAAYVTSDVAVTPAQGIDYQIAVSSLGRHLRPHFASFPKHSGYLKADPVKVAAMRARYEARAQGRRIVGVSWQSTAERIGADKSVQLTDLAPLLRVPGVLFVNLQYGDCSTELTAARKQLDVDIHHDPAVDPLTDMDAFFAQVAAMDLVVTTSSTTVHVAGALNTPVWLLLPYAKGSIWYWFLKREDSPWYPSAKLIRQPKPDLSRPWWQDVVTRVANDLTLWASSTGGAQQKARGFT